MFGGQTIFPRWSPKPATDYAFFIGPFCGQSQHFCSLMEYCSPLWADAPASHIALLDAVESNALKIIGTSRDNVKCLSLLLSPRRQVGGLSVFYLQLFGLASSALCWICPSQVSVGCLSARNSVLVKLPNPRLTAHLHSFVPPPSHL